jgi:enamine deaminase RidA (YjgF/YER057c/UK114 family)
LSSSEPPASGHSAITRLAGDPPSPWEAVYGYSRTVAAGPWVLIGGTTSVDPTGFVVGTTPYEQTVEILRKLEHELDRVGLSFADVVQTRMYVTDISRADEVGRAHGDAFGRAGAGGEGGGPVATMVEVSGLIDPRMLVEIELVAYPGSTT